MYIDDNIIMIHDYNIISRIILCVINYFSNLASRMIIFLCWYITHTIHMYTYYIYTFWIPLVCTSSIYIIVDGNKLGMCIFVARAWDKSVQHIICNNKRIICNYVDLWTRCVDALTTILNSLLSCIYIIY